MALAGGLAVAGTMGAGQAPAQQAQAEAAPAAGRAGAQPPAGAQGPATTLDAVSVTAERNPSSVFDSPGTVSVIDAREIDRKAINRPADLAREEPGVSVANQPARGGATNFAIRGIGDNRVRVQVDGFRVPDFPESNRGAGNYTRDFVDFDGLKQVEIIRGPASALYGSDAIGGVVSYVTKDPGDYLAGRGVPYSGPVPYFASAKLGVDSVDRSYLTTLTGAARVGEAEALVVYTRREGHEARPNGRLAPNPQDALTQNVLAKIVHDAGAWGRFRLTGELFHRRLDTTLLTDRLTTGGGRSAFTTVFDSRGEDTTTRPRVSFDWTLPVTLALADTIQARALWTRVDREELSVQERGVGTTALRPAAANRLRLSDFDFSQRIVGGEVQATASRELWGWTHLVTYGATLEGVATSRPRDRTEVTLPGGAVTRVIAGDVFPNKNFPDTDTRFAGLYVQDTASYGRLRIIPAVRFDRFDLTPGPDAAFQNSNLRGFTISKQTETAVSPKLGATYDLSDTWRAAAQYARGFRAPPYDNANFAFSNPVQFYEVLPNGNLKPETSDSYEGSLRGRLVDGSSVQLTAFVNRYRDFLDTRVIGVTPAGLTQFQYQNVARVRIRGLEGKGELRLDEEWALFGAAAYAEGIDETTGRAVDGADPLTGLGGLRYRRADGWGAEVRARGAAAKSKVSSPATVLRPGAHATLDAFLTYDLGERVAFNAGITNLLDRRYFGAADVAGLPTTNPNLELFRAAGRAVAVNATVRW